MENDEHKPGSEHKAGRYLTFQVAGKYYALPQQSVREMMPVQDVFPPLLPDSLNWGSGLMGFLHTQSIRVPIFDLHVRLGGPVHEIHLTNQTRIVTVDVHGFRTAFYADRLNDMILVRCHEIRRDTITGHGRPKVILTPECLWTPQELAALA